MIQYLYNRYAIHGWGNYRGEGKNVVAVANLVGAVAMLPLTVACALFNPIP